MTDESAFHQELAERAERGALLPAVHLIIENTGLSTADAKRYYDDFVASRGIVVNPLRWPFRQPTGLNGMSLPTIRDGRVLSLSALWSGSQMRPNAVKLATDARKSYVYSQTHPPVPGLRAPVTPTRVRIRPAARR